MPEEKDGQAQAGQPAKKPTFDEIYAKGWETIDADDAAEAAAKPSEKTPAQQLAEQDCPDCPGGKPFKIIKHNGKDVMVKTEKEYNDLVQMGFDYTKKTQALAEERRKLETDKASGTSEYQKLLDRLDRLEKGSAPRVEGDNGKARPADKPAETPADDEAKVFADYGLDPDYASDFEKKLVRDVVKNKRDLEASRELTQMIVMKEMTKTISAALADAVKEFPVEDVLDEKGNDLTGQIVISEFKSIVADPANQKTPIGDLAKMAVRRVYDAQMGRKGAPSDADMTLDDFAKRFPKAFEKLKATGTARTEDSDDLPPSITGRKGSVPAADQRPRPRFKGLSEAIDAGMEDPEIKALFGG
jgi:hypothetical protein